MVLYRRLELRTYFGVVIEMTKEQIIDLLMLLSAMESWGNIAQTRLPDYLGERIAESVDVLRKEVVKND